MELAQETRLHAIDGEDACLEDGIGRHEPELRKPPAREMPLAERLRACLEAYDH
jgi:hypothetical protein